LFPKMNPAQMAKIMNQMGIKNEPIEASRVIVEKPDGSKLVIENPQVTLIDMQGQKSLQVAGDFVEEAGKEDKGQSDVDLVMQSVPSASREAAEQALKEADGDIAQAIMSLEK